MLLMAFTLALKLQYCCMAFILLLASCLLLPFLLLLVPLLFLAFPLLLCFAGVPAHIGSPIFYGIAVVTGVPAVDGIPAIARIATTAGVLTIVVGCCCCWHALWPSCCFVGVVFFCLRICSCCWHPHCLPAVAGVTTVVDVPVAYLLAAVLTYLMLPSPLLGTDGQKIYDWIVPRIGQVEKKSSSVLDR
jgi:hypothetical protein